MTEHNGWMNRETWAVNLHWANHRDAYEYTNGLVDVARQYARDFGSPIPNLPEEDDARVRLAGAMREHLSDEIDAVFSAIEESDAVIDRVTWGIMADFVRQGMARVAFHELAKSWAEAREPVEA